MTVNTIAGLRINQWGIENTAATGTLTIDTRPTAADTLTVGATTYEIVNSGAIAGQINKGANLAGDQANIVAAINGSDGINPANASASIGNFSVNVATLTARVPGTAGNSVATTETFTAGTNVFNAAALSGGAGAKGTAVAATSQIAVQKLDWDDTDEVIFRPQFANGYLVRNRGASTPVKHGSRFSFSDEPVVWEQLPHWLGMAVKGAVTPVYTGGVYRWTFTRTPTADPVLDSRTIERRFSDGQGNYIDQRMSYGMLEEWSVKYAAGEPLKHSGKGFARKAATNTLTAGQSLPTPQLAVSALSKVYADTTWGAIGGTMLTEQVIGWEIGFKTGAYPQWTAEGRSALDWTKHLMNAGNVQMTLKLMLLLDPTQYATENTAADAGTTRAVQLYVSGGSSRLMKINGLFQHTKPFITKFGEQDGQDIVNLELEETTDGTNFLSVILDHPSVYSVA